MLFSDFPYLYFKRNFRHMNLDLIATMLIAGGLLLLSFLHLSNVTSVNRRANLLFGIFTFQWSTFWLDELLFSEHLNTTSAVFIILRTFQFLVPITFFLSVKFYTEPDTRLTWKHGGIAIAPAVFLLYLLFRPSVKNELFEVGSIVFFLGHSVFYVIWAHAKILKHQRAIKSFHSYTEKIDLRWIKYITYSFIGSATIVTAYNFLTKAESLSIYINLFFVAVVYLVAFYSLRQKEIYPQGIELSDIVSNNTLIEQQTDVPKVKVIEDADLHQLKEKLLRLMELEKPYLNSELNLVKLAEQMNLTTHQLSYLINNAMGENFFNFINRYRVRKAKELLKNSDYDHLNVLVIAYESGFNSKTSFNNTFKKMTNYTPTEYRKSSV